MRGLLFLGNQLLGKGKVSSKTTLYAKNRLSWNIRLKEEGDVF